LESEIIFIIFKDDKCKLKTWLTCITASKSSKMVILMLTSEHYKISDKLIQYSGKVHMPSTLCY